MSGSRAQDRKGSPKSVEMHDMSTAVPAVPAASAAPNLSSLPASPSFAPREEMVAGATLAEAGREHADGLRIRVWYLDDALARAEPKFVPDVAALKQLLPGADLTFPMSASPTMTADHFAEVPYTQPSAAAARGGGRGLAAATSNQTLDTMGSLSDRQSYPSISLRPSSPTHAGGHPAWVSVKAPSPSELTEILDWLPIHVLTRRRIAAILCMHDDDATQENSGDGDAPGEANGTSKRGSRTRRGSGANEPARNSEEEEEDDVDSDDDDDEEERRHGHHDTARDNFLEYFPAHGYAVLCLQAVPLPKGESTRRGATPKEELITHGTQVPSTPVVALAFESTLFTFSLSRFGGEGDVRLIVANHVASPASHTARHGMPARVTTIATLSSTPALSEMERAQRESARRAAVDSAPEPCTPAFDGNTSLVETIPHSNNRYGAAAAAHAAAPPPLAYPPHFSDASLPTFVSSPSHYTESPTTTGTLNWSAATAISVVCSSLISAIIAYLQQSTRSLLMEADQLDELVLQILPSRVDQDDMLVRTKSIRNLIAAFHIDALQKERVLKQLLLPAMRQTPLSQSTQAIERYQRSLSSVRSTVLKLRKGRDIVNMASMTLISGVSARLLTHCNFMDYLNHVQTQIAVVVMPIAVIPGIFATNVAVPWMNSTSMTPFYCILTITLALMIIGVTPPLYKFYKYRSPKALAPLD